MERHIPIHMISTHAPRTGSDTIFTMLLLRISNFNPRSTHGERRQHYDRTRYHLLFQPTLPARGATRPTMTAARSRRFQPTLPARGATALDHVAQVLDCISTHAPRTGSDVYTHSGETVSVISTHAPRTGSDRPRTLCGAPSCHFNPRSPHGERHVPGKKDHMIYKFQPTLPARGATSPDAGRSREPGFQPTLPARGATLNPVDSHKSFYDFNPRSPHGERPSGGQSHCRSSRFQPTLPARGATYRRAWRRVQANFNPRSPHGERPVPSSIARDTSDFNPRSPHGERRDLVHLVNASLDDFNPRSPHGERRSRRPFPPGTGYFNPRSPHGERRETGNSVSIA